MDKIKEAQEILKEFGLPESQQNKISALTLLALANIKPEANWEMSTSKSMTLSKDIMGFVNEYYDAGYKPNTRESFRKIALKPFVDNNIALLNPDDTTLSPSSSKTHYALSPIALETIKKYSSNEWNEAIDAFKKNQFVENLPSNVLLEKITIKNYKSIFEETIELGKFNVFIGVNGCGKTNILEAIATVGSSLASELTFEGLYSRGVRMARPNLTISSFLNTPKEESINISLQFNDNGITNQYESSLVPDDPNDFYTKWRDVKLEDFNQMNLVVKWIEDIYQAKGQISEKELLVELNTLLKNNTSDFNKINYHKSLSDYAIFDLNTKSLRGVIPADSRKTPLGINGEGLDLLIANFNSYEKEYLKKCQIFFDWLDTIYSDKDEKAKVEGLKLGRSSSTLYFTDRFMQKQNNTFSAENSNEGILHVLFYIALFISNKTPNIFAIDNIETALNPRLCQTLITELVKLSKERGKQALITTHNPAVLDGLNLSDDDQRLFEVYRDSEGKTRARRIKFKSDLSNKPFKLSEMWLKGSLGAVPINF